MAFLKGCTSGYRNDLNVIEGELQAIKQDVYKFKLYLNTACVWQSNSSVMRQLPRCAEVWIWGRWTFHSVLLFLICQQKSWARQRIGARVKNLFWLRISSRLQNSIKTVCLNSIHQLTLLHIAQQWLQSHGSDALAPEPHASIFITLFLYLQFS